MPPAARSIAAVFALALSIACVATAQDEQPGLPMIVLTGTQATFSITHALTVDTPIEVVNVPDDGREMAVLRPYIERRKERFADLFARATAVVSLTNALPADPLYRYARAANVRIVDIDAAIPWTYDTPGVALIDAPRSDVTWAAEADSDDQPAATSPYFWLSISNSMRMADIVAGDLIELFPSFAATLSANHERYRQWLLDLRNTHQDQLLAAPDDTVFALTGDFAYMTNDLGLFVDGYFIKQDVDWTPADLAALTAHLEERDIRVVIHKWMPDDTIQAAIQAAQAQLVVLETGDQGRLTDDKLAADGLQAILEDNLKKITSALSR